MSDKTLTCKSCGGSSFAVGDLEHVYAHQSMNKKTETTPKYFASTRVHEEFIHEKEPHPSRQLGSK